MSSIDEKDVLDGDALNELYRWIDAVPLSRPKRNIARDFSDGVSVAEIIHHYLPRAVELHNYGVASATGQKRINWNTLNRKVFGKLNIKLNDATLTNVIECKPGAIEQVLWDLRVRILQHATSTSSIDPKRELTFSKSQTGSAYRMAAAASMKAIVAQKGSVRSIAQASFNPRQMKSKLNTAIPLAKDKVQPKVSFTFVQRKASGYKTPGISRDSRTTLESTAEEPFPKQSSLLGLSEIPSQIVFRGHKMVSVEVLESKEKDIKDLENVAKQLNLKIDRLQILVQIKEDRIEDLSHQLSNIRSMYEHATSHIVKIDPTKAAVKTDATGANNNIYPQE